MTRMVAVTIRIISSRVKIFRPAVTNKLVLRKNDDVIMNGKVRLKDCILDTCSRKYCFVWDKSEMDCVTVASMTVVNGFLAYKAMRRLQHQV